jgi:5-methylcytosine-specific restriction endonuclease McrA
MVHVRPNQPALRYAVFKRDGGICATCGFDTEALRVRLLLLPYGERELERRRLGIPVGRTSYFDVHHIIPVADGGTDTLTNTVTLCWKCHSKETTAYASARATGRRAAARGQGGAPQAARERIDASMSEAEWQWQVVQCAAANGWTVWHDNDARRNNGGFPDLVLIRERVVWAELKRATGRVSAVQRWFRDVLIAAGAEAYIWYPKDWVEVQRVLARTEGDPA